MAYKSRYETQLASALGNITGRDKFKYDFNADPLYHMYKDQYVKLGNDAAANAAATVAGLTGGYGSSYATTAAAQANQNYLTKLNDIVPQLYNQALNAYMAEGDRLTDLYKTLSDAEAAEYSKYRDTVADDQWQKNFDENVRQWQENYNENKRQWQANYDEGVRQYNQNYAYQQERDKVADEQWQANYDEGVRQYNQNYDYQKSRDTVADNQWQKNYDYQVGRDKVSDEQWEKNFAEAVRQYNQNYDYQVGRDAVQDSQWERTFAAQQAALAAKSYASPSYTTTTTTTNNGGSEPTWRNSYKTYSSISESQWKDLTNTYKNIHSYSDGETTLNNKIASIMSSTFNIESAIQAYKNNGYSDERANALAQEDYNNIWLQIKNRIIALAGSNSSSTGKGKNEVKGNTTNLLK